MPDTLTEQEITSSLEELSGWRYDNGELVLDLKFESFAQAMEMVNQVARLAEETNHHPDIDIRYNKVRLALVSHDVGGITKRDTKLAAKISAL